MNVIKPRIASGFPEYLPEEQIEFNRLLDIVRDVYEKYGFSPIDTPDLELREILLAKGGGETDQQVYDFTRGKNDFVMRFDLTVPLARYAAQHENELTFPFRRYHIAKVHRAERAQAGRFREFYQCDIDIIGTNSSVVDAEIPAVINDIFGKFNFGEFTININDRRILNGFFASIGLADKKTEVMRLVDKIDKISLDDFRQELRELGLDESQSEKLIEFTKISGDNKATLDQLANIGIEDSEYIAGLENLQTVVKTLQIFKVPENRFKVNLKIARGLDYYTGTVYETMLDDHPEVGSVCSGGRFDNLASHYTKTDLPGVGISIGLSRLFYKLREIDVIKADAKSPASVVVLPMSDNEVAFAAKIAQTLRENNISNILYTEPGKFDKKMRYADRMGFKYALIIGEIEVKEGTLTVKKMLTGETSNISFNDINNFDW
jgi:histidyl-tRNA synthetase